MVHVVAIYVSLNKWQVMVNVKAAPKFLFVLSLQLLLFPEKRSGELVSDLESWQNRPRSDPPTHTFRKTTDGSGVDLVYARQDAREEGVWGC